MTADTDDHVREASAGAGAGPRKRRRHRKDHRKTLAALRAWTRLVNEVTRQRVDGKTPYELIDSLPSSHNRALLFAWLYDIYSARYQIEWLLGEMLEELAEQKAAKEARHDHA